MHPPASCGRRRPPDLPIPGAARRNHQNTQPEARTGAPADRCDSEPDAQPAPCDRITPAGARPTEVLRRRAALYCPSMARQPVRGLNRRALRGLNRTAPRGSRLACHCAYGGGTAPNSAPRRTDGGVDALCTPFGARVVDGRLARGAHFRAAKIPSWKPGATLEPPPRAVRQP